jgi:hypothetical protein
MATGYTAAIADGISFEDFALSCARAFGACIYQRDRDDDAPRLAETPSYHVEGLKEAQEEYDRLSSLSEDQRRKMGRKLQGEALMSLEVKKQKDTELRNKYEAMLKKIADWKPPTENHNGLKEFMRDQIEKSIVWDCKSLREYDDLIQVASNKPDWAYFDAELASRQWAIEYHTKELKRANDHIKEGNTWILDLYASLGRTYE